jgi:hypothetical protein
MSENIRKFLADVRDKVAADLVGRAILSILATLVALAVGLAAWAGCPKQKAPVGNDVARPADVTASAQDNPQPKTEGQSLTSGPRIGQTPVKQLPTSPSEKTPRDARPGDDERVASQPIVTNKPVTEPLDAEGEESRVVPTPLFMAQNWRQADPLPGYPFGDPWHWKWGPVTLENGQVDVHGTGTFDVGNWFADESLLKFTAEVLRLPSSVRRRPCLLECKDTTSTEAAILRFEYDNFVRLLIGELDATGQIPNPRYEIWFRADKGQEDSEKKRSLDRFPKRI